MDDDLPIHRPDFHMVQCLSCRGQFSISAESLYKLQGLLKPEQIKVPRCIFCDSIHTKLKDQSYVSSKP